MYKIEIQGNSMEEFKNNLKEIVMVYFPLPSWTEAKEESKPVEDIKEELIIK